MGVASMIDVHDEAEVRRYVTESQKRIAELEEAATEREQAEQKLRDAEAELRHTIDVAPGIIARANAHTGFFVQCNPALSSILGFSTEEFLARPFVEFIHPDDRQRTVNEVEKQLKGHPVARFQNRYICRDGSYKWLEWAATPADEQGIVYAAATDITERKLAEEALARQHDVEELVGKMAASFINLPLDEVDTSITDSLQAIAGYAGAVRSSVFILSDDLETATNTHEWCASPGDSQIERLREIPFETFGHYARLLREHRNVIISSLDDLPPDAEGERKWAEQYGFRPVFLVPMLLSGRLRGAVGFYGEVDAAHIWQDEVLSPLRLLTDIISNALERKRVEAALRQSEDKYRQLVESLPSGIVHVTIDGRIVLANQEAQRHLGLPYDEITRKYVRDWEGITLREDGSACPVTELPVSKCLQTGAPQPGEVIGVSRPDGSVSWAVYSAIPVFEQERLSGAVVAFTDVGARKELEAQLLQSQKMEAIGRLAGGVAHDFNNLLTGITGYASLIQEDLDPDDPSARKTGEILAICKRARDLTMNLLGFARKGKFHKKRIDLNESIRQVREILQQTISKKIIIKTQITENPAGIEGDSGQINQILMNLCINAADAMSNGGTLTIASRDAVIEQAQPRQHADLEPGRYVELSVADTGGGMDTEIMEKAFEPFFTTKPQGEGTGLGLSMVYGAVMNHGGTVTVDSEPGQGTKVIILLPAIEPDSVAATPAAEQLTVLATGRGTILVVDDESIVRNTTAMLLQSLGYQVIKTGDGKEAVEVYQQKQAEITLVLLDMVMPVMDGTETFHKLKEINPAARVLLFSGYSADATANALIDEGAFGFLQKPFDPGKLADAVAEALAT